MLLCLGACAEYPWAPEEDGAVMVPLDLSSRLPLVKVVVDGLGPHWFVLDTSTPYIVLNNWFAEDWLAGRGVTKIDRPTNLMQLDKVQIGGVTVPAQAARAADLSPLERSIGLPVAGRLGMAVFQDHLVTIDYPNGWLVLSKGSLPVADGVEIFDSAGILETKIAVRIDGHEVFARIDSANPHGLSIEKRFRERALNMMLYPGESVWRNGALQLGQVGRVPVDVFAGAYVFQRPYVVVVDGGGVSFGHGILKNFVLQIDVPNSRVALRRQAGYQLPAEPFQGVGCVFQRRGREWVVREVLPGTVASRLGISKSDTVVAIEGQPAYRVSPRAWRELLSKKQRVRLQIKKGNQVQEKVLPVYSLVPESG